MHDPVTDQRTYGQQIHDLLQSLPDPRVNLPAYAAIMTNISRVASTAALDAQDSTAGNFSYIRPANPTAEGGQ
ncbi:MAG: hypothetical protein H7Z12_19935 [Rhodospirillaceae bacterium]|nr:hypothetical protein [Rhodospirillales bacterium]